MYTSLLLFIIAMLGIVILITRKILALNSSGEVYYKNKDVDLEFELPDLDEVKEFTNKRLKKYGYALLVVTLRLYVLGSSKVKKGAIALYNKIEQKLKKLTGKKTVLEQNKEASGFIKTMSEYKKKINKITHKIKQEEGIK